MDDAALIALYEHKAEGELTEAVVGSYELTQSILAAHPEMAQDAGFELFDRAWATRYWRSIVSEVSGIKPLDKVQGWAVGATISQLAALIVSYYALPAVALSAAVALAVILLRAAAAKPEAGSSPTTP